MKVQLMTNVIDDLIGSKLTLNLPEGACLRSLIDKLLEDYGKGVKEKLFNRDKLRSHITILVNGRMWLSSDLEKELPQPCEISIIQMLSGG